MQQDFLDLKLGSKKRTLTIMNISQNEIEMKDGSKSSKASFTVMDPNTKFEFKVSDAWVEDAKGAKKIQGLWLPAGKSIQPSSALAKVMQYYKVDAIKDLINKDVIAYPDNNDYLVLTACDMPEDFEQKVEKAELFK